jgi:hypothetical protein
MIRTEVGVKSTHEALGKVQLALLDIYQHREKYGQNYTLCAEPLSN